MMCTFAEKTMKYISILLLLLVFNSCKEEKKKQLTAQEVINKTIENAAMKKTLTAEQYAEWLKNE